MGRINVLPPEVAAQIAAGEVVERPASVVKELIENALDAGAKRVTVRVEEGGKRIICVGDDGWGMDKEDAILAFQRHATSKIKDASDLRRVVTMGFRGEALPSIASVSHVELVTRPPDAEQGTRVVVEGGMVKAVETVGCPKGTTVTVKGLFFNTPARLKFLKSNQTEFAHITEVLGRYILSFPEVAFSLHHGGREILRYTPTGDERAPLAEVLGRELARRLIPVHFSQPPYTVRGFISPPTVTKPTRSHQWFFVNRRYVRSPLLSSTVRHAYHGFIPEGRHPIIVLSLEVPFELVDVNVHPAKIEVRFRKETEVQGILVRAIKEALVSAQVVPIATGLRSPPSPKSPPSYPSKELSDFRTLLQVKFGRGRPDKASSQSPPPKAPPPLAASPAPPLLISRPASLTPLKQLGATYILAENERGDLFIVCQHRAHERWLFEHLLRRSEGLEVTCQGLIVPFTLSLGRAQATFVTEHLSTLRRAGFELEPFGPDTFLVRTVPTLLIRHDYEQILHDLIDELTTGNIISTGELFHDILATVACKAAVKAGEPLSPEEMQRLLDDLLTLENPAFCPHGQPILIALSKEELDKRFRR